MWSDLLETLGIQLLDWGKGMCHENLIVHVLKIYLICFTNAFSKLSLIFAYKEKVHWFRNSFKLVQLRQILEASCGYAIKFGLVRQERDWKINKHDMFYEYLKQFWVWCLVDWQPKATRGSYALKTWQQASRGFIPCRLATSKATRGCIPWRYGNPGHERIFRSL